MITIHQVSKTFPSPQGPVAALEAVSLRVAAGEFVAVIGPSGCGKSTLLRLIAELEQPDAGSLVVGGKTPREARLAHEYGIVFQAPVLYPWRTVRQNVELPLEITGQPRATRRSRADDLLRRVGLGDMANAYPQHLSGGMQQRVALARALAFTPRILLMDEPFAALDELTRERMQQELLAICADPALAPSVIFVTHSIAEAVFLADRVVVFSPRPGRVERVVEINLPRPRTPATRNDPRYFALITAVRAGLR